MSLSILSCTVLINYLRFPVKNIAAIPWCDLKISTCTFENFDCRLFFMPIPVAARSKAWVFGRSAAEIVVSNPSLALTAGRIMPLMYTKWDK
jgi:hypothetical protein